MFSFMNQPVSSDVISVVGGNTEGNMTSESGSASKRGSGSGVTLDELGLKYDYGRVVNSKKVGKQEKGIFLGGDKSSAGRNYLYDYEKLLGGFRDQDDFRLLEIGILEGRSMAMWSDYFPRGQIIGLDICLDYLDEQMLRDKYGAFQNNNVKFLEGDSTLEDQEVIAKFGLVPYEAETGRGGYQVIIDDGDHHWESQMQTWDNVFFKYLRPGGIYIIEDCFQSQIVVPLCRIMIDVLLCGTQSVSRPENMKKYVLEKGKNNKYIRYIESIKIERSRIVIVKRDF